MPVTEINDTDPSEVRRVTLLMVLRSCSSKDQMELLETFEDLVFLEGREEGWREAVKEFGR